MELVTGFQGKNHVTARQVSRLISGLATDGETYVLKTLDQLPAELLNANTVSVGTGDIIADGTYFTVEAPEEITIENGVTGLNRNDLIVARYLKAEPAVDEDGVPDYTIPRVESGELAVVKGAPSSGDPDDPAVVEASIYDDNTTLAEFPLYRIPIRGLSVGTPEPLFKILPPGAERWDSLSQVQHAVVSGRSNAYGNVALFNDIGLWGNRHRILIVGATEQDANRGLLRTSSNTYRLVVQNTTGWSCLGGTNYTADVYYIMLPESD